MKNIIFAALLLFGCIGAFAQERIISQSEFETLLVNSTEKLKGKSYRTTIDTKSSAEGRPQTDFSSKMVLEFVSPTIRHTFFESTFQTGTRINESIRIGDKVYTREGDGNWQEKTFEAVTANKSKATVAENQDEGQPEYKYLGIEKLDNKDARVYTKISIRKSIDPATGRETSSINTTKYWFSEDGFLLKSDLVSDAKSGVMKFYTRVTQVWETDVNLNIEAPKITEPAK